MLKLTGAADRRPVYVAAQHIGAIAPAMDGNTAVGLIGKVVGSTIVVLGMALAVTEFPDVIARMVDEQTPDPLEMVPL